MADESELVMVRSKLIDEITIAVRDYNYDEAEMLINLMKELDKVIEKRMNT